MRFLLTIFIFLLSIVLHGQVKIVKDNIACLYGLKHVSGEWIVKPEFTLIRATTNNQYLLLKDNKFGLAEIDGKIIVETIYNRIESTDANSGYYYYSIGDSYGIMDKKGKIIIPSGKFTHIITSYKPDYFVCQNKNGSYLYYKSNQLNKIPVDVINFWSNWGDSYFHFKMNKKKKKFQYLLRAQEPHDTLLMVYKGEINIHQNHLIATYNDSTLIYDQLKNLKLTLHNSPANLYDINFNSLNENQIYSFIKNGKCGLSNFKNEILVNPIYQNIHIYRPDSKRCRYYISQNNLIGFMSSSFEVTAPPEYQMQWPNGMYDIMLMKKKNKIAVFDTAAHQLSEHIYTPLFDDYQQFLYDSITIYKLNKQVTLTETNLYSEKMTKGIFKLKLGQFSLYQFKNTYIPFYKSGNDYSYNQSMRAGLYNNEYILYYNGQTLYYDTTGKAIDKNVKKSLNTLSIGNGYSILQTNGKYGIIDEKENIVLPVENSMIFPAEGNDDNWVWVRKEITNNTRFKEPMAGHWYLYKTDGSLVTDMVFDIPVTIKKEASIVYVNNNCGLYDFTNTKFIIEPNYHYINQHFGITDHYLLYNHEKDFYVIKNDGQLVTQDKWKHMIITNRFSRYLNLPKINGIDPNNYYVSAFKIFLNETDTMAIAANGDTTTHSQFIKELIHKGNISNKNDPHNLHLYYNYINYPNPDIYPEVLNETIDFLIKNDSIDFKFKPENYWAELIPHMDIFFNNKMPSYFGLPRFDSGISLDVELKYVADNYVSFVNNRTFKGPQYFNLFRAYGYLFEFGLEDLFLPEINIDDVMIISLTEAIHDRDDLFLNCHDPRTIFDLTGKQFYFDLAGLHLTLLDEKNETKEIVITWLKLKKYAPEKGIVNDFLKMNSN